MFGKNKFNDVNRIKEHLNRQENKPIFRHPTKIFPWWSPFRIRNLMILGFIAFLGIMSPIIVNVYDGHQLNKRFKKELKDFRKQLDEEDRLYEIMENKKGNK